MHFRFYSVRHTSIPIFKGNPASDCETKAFGLAQQVMGGNSARLPAWAHQGSSLILFILTHADNLDGKMFAKTNFTKHPSKRSIVIKSLQEFQLSKLT